MLTLDHIKLSMGPVNKNPNFGIFICQIRLLKKKLIVPKKMIKLLCGQSGQPGEPGLSGEPSRASRAGPVGPAGPAGRAGSVRRTGPAGRAGPAGDYTLI